MEAQVQIRVIDLAWEWIKDFRQTDSTAKGVIEEQAQRFDQAYKAILKTVEQKPPDVSQ